MVEKPIILARHEIPLGHWGIVTQEAFDALVQKKGFDHALLRIFQKRWDPLSNHLDITRGIETQIPDKFVGDYTLISVLRDERVHEIKDTKKEQPKIFPDIVDGRDYSIVLTKDDKKNQDPFSDKPRLETLTDCTAATMINRFPAYGRVIDDSVWMCVQPSIENKITKISKGISLVTIPTAYYEAIENIPKDILARMFLSQAEAVRIIEQCANSIGIKYIPFDLFFNVGPKVGGSIQWLHSQTYIDLNQDGHGKTMEEHLRAFEFQQRHGGCLFCKPKQWTPDFNDFLLYENDAVILQVNPAPQTNFETIFFMKRHMPDLLTATGQEFFALADALARAFAALNKIPAVDHDRNILIYQRPLGYSSLFHVFGKIVPYEIKGGKERIDNARVAQFHPKNVANYLRQTGCF